MLKMTSFYEPGVDDQMVLRKFWNEDLQIKAIENAEAICQEDEESLYGIFDGIWQNRNYGALLEQVILWERTWVIFYKMEEICLLMMIIKYKYYSQLSGGYKCLVWSAFCFRVLQLIPSPFQSKVDLLKIKVDFSN